MMDTIPMENGQRFRVKPAGERWEIEYLSERVEQGEAKWVVTAVKPVYDKAVWLLWQISQINAEAPPAE